MTSGSSSYSWGATSLRGPPEAAASLLPVTLRWLWTVLAHLLIPQWGMVGAASATTAAPEEETAETDAH